MQIKFLLLLALLTLNWTVSSGQDILTRDQKEAIAKDLITGDQCSAERTELKHQIGLLKDQISEGNGVRIQLEGKITDYKDVIVPAVIDERNTRSAELDIVKKKLKTTKFWSIAKDVVIGGLLVELSILALEK